MRAGIGLATGDYLIIQDADLEYDPADYIPMFQKLQEPGVDAVYGSRYMKHPEKGKVVNLLTGKHPNQGLLAYAGGQGIALGMAAGALMLLPVGVADAGSELFTAEVLAIGLAVAVLSSAIPYTLELEALRRMPAGVFGVLMSLEPAAAGEGRTCSAAGRTRCTR